MTFKKGNKKGINVAEASEVNQATIVAPEPPQEGLKANPEMAGTDLKFLSSGKPLKLIMAEMIYYGTGMREVPFETIGPEEQQMFLSHGRICLETVDKLNLMIVPKRDLIKERLENKQSIMDVVTAFMAAMNAPKDLHKTFPIEELSIRIMEGRTK